MVLANFKLSAGLPITSHRHEKSIYHLKDHKTHMRVGEASQGPLLPASPPSIMGQEHTVCISLLMFIYCFCFILYLTSFSTHVLREIPLVLHNFFLPIVPAKWRFPAGHLGVILLSFNVVEIFQKFV